MTFISHVNNVATGEVIEVEMTEKEIAERKAQIAKSLEEKKKREEEDAAVASRKAALLEKLGITEEEARLLLG